MGRTLVALYDGPATAKTVVRELHEAHFTPAEIRQVNPEDFEQREPAETDILGISGMVKPEIGEFEEAVRQGCSLVAVTASETNLNRAHEVLIRHRPIDLEQKVEQWRTSGWKNPYEGVRDQDPRRVSQYDEVQTGRDRSSTAVRMFMW